MKNFPILTAWLLSLWIHNWIQAQTDTTQKQIQEVYISEDWRDTLFLPVKNKWNNTQQETCKDFLQKGYIIVNNDLPEKIESHEDFITTRIDKIFKLYWKEKALELINEHMLIEINKFREENWKPPLKLDPQIQELSQERAEQLYNENSCEHWKWNDSLWARIQQKKIKYIVGRWENIWQWLYTIKDSNNAFEISEGHRDLLLKDECNFCWTGVKCTNVWNNNETEDTIFIWNDNKTGDTAIYWGRKYQKNNEPFRVHWCVTIVQKDETDQEKIPKKEE